MTDMVTLQKARERMNLRKALWFRCIDRAVPAQAGTPTYDAYSRALGIIAEAYSVSCREVRMLEEHGRET